MLKALDKVWFWFKNRSIGYDSGYNDGFRAAMSVTHAQALARLKEKNPGLSDKTFQLGYDHAVEVVKGNIK
jgi:hypothetical protein